jgi:hypothetical protein
MLNNGSAAAMLAAVCLSLGACQVDPTTINMGGPDCAPPIQGVQTIEENSRTPLCDGDTPATLKAIPTPAQMNELIATIESFGPGFGVSIDGFDRATMSVCASLLGKAAKSEIESSARKWFRNDGRNVSLKQSATIVDQIVAQGWCI